MEKASKERQTLKNTKRIPIKKIPILLPLPLTLTLTKPITKTITTTTEINPATTKQHGNEAASIIEEAKAKSKADKQQQQQRENYYKNHETYRKVQEKSKNNNNNNTEKAACNAAYKFNKPIKMAATANPAAKATAKATAKIAKRAKRLYRKNSVTGIYNDAANIIDNNTKNSNDDAFKKNNFQAETTSTSMQLLPYIAKNFATTKANYIQQIREQTQTQQQQQQNQKQQQQQQMTLAKSEIAIKRAFSEFELLSNCSRNAQSIASIQYNKNNVSIKNFCANNTLNNSIKIKKQQKSSSNFQKLLQYITLSKLKSSNHKSSSKSRSNNNSAISISNSSYNLDLRSFVYVALFLLIYCTMLIRASAVAAAANDVAFSKQNQFLTVNISKNVNALAGMKTKTENEIVSNIIFTDSNLNATIENATVNRTLSMVYRKNSSNSTHRLYRRDAANVPDDDDDSSYHDDEFDEYDALIRNKSAKGKYIGAPCDEMKCDSTLLHVTCDKETLTCGCEKNYPVQLGLTKGCDKPKKLGEQCFYDVTCMYNDENSLCVQVRHNALCQCASGFHSVSYTKPTRRVFCTQDLKELTSDLPTLLGVTTGIAVLAGLICMVLHLFSKTKYPRHRNFGDASIPPPIMYSSDTEFDMPTRFPGIPLIVQSGRPSSRSSLRSSGSIGSYGNRRSSSGGVIGGGGSGGIGIGGGAGIGVGVGVGSGSKGILVSTSRTGSRRPSLASVHSTSSSVRSYSMMRFEKETQQKEIRQEMKLRLARLQQQQQMSQNRPQIIIGDALTMLSGRSEHGASGSGSGATAMTAFSRLSMATPSPLTPNSTDELLPVVDETQEYPLKSEMLPMTSTKPKAAAATTFVAAATLTAVQEIATTSTMALAAAAAERANVAQNIGENSITNDAATGTQQLNKAPISETGAYIGPCTSSSEAL